MNTERNDDEAPVKSKNDAPKKKICCACPETKASVNEWPIHNDQHVNGNCIYLRKNRADNHMLGHGLQAPRDECIGIYGGVPCLETCPPS